MTILPHPSAGAPPLSGPALQLTRNHRKDLESDGGVFISHASGDWPEENLYCRSLGTTDGQT